MLVFSKEKYEADMAKIPWPPSTVWPPYCYNQPVKRTSGVYGKVKGTDRKTYKVHIDWCEEVEEELM